MNNDSEVAHPRSGSSFTRFLIELESVWKCWFLRREETVVPREKPLRAKERTNSLLIPRMARRGEASDFTAALFFLHM